MPVHDWTSVSAGAYHDFRNSWIIHLKESLNAGLLPTGYDAMSELHAGEMIPDVLTLQREEFVTDGPPDSGGVAVLQAPPRTKIKHLLEEHTSYRQRQKTLTIRQTGSDRLVSIVEIASPSNNDRAQSVVELVYKLRSTLKPRVHVLLIDLIPPGAHDLQCIQAALCEGYEIDYAPPAGQRLTLAAYIADRQPTAHAEPVAVGDSSIDMPIFLSVERYIPAPLGRTCMGAYRGMPGVWKNVLDAPA